MDTHTIMTAAADPATWERELLLGRLAQQRRHILDAIDGLDDEQLRRPVLPSGWSIVGLLRHLTLGNERYWFETVVGGTPMELGPHDQPGSDGDWHADLDAAPATIIADYEASIAAADAVIAGFTLDAPPSLPEPWWDEYGMRFPDLRSVVLHVIVDTAVHAGHLDAVRELIDGRQHLVL